MINTGKYVEKAVEVAFKNYMNPKIHWIRLPDAASSRGRVAAQPADFFLCYYGRPVYLECKSQKGKNNRLKKPTQDAALRRWELTGVQGWILVHFHEMGRIFLARIIDLEPGKSSWILDESNSAEFDTVEEALVTLL